MSDEIDRAIDEAADALRRETDSPASELEVARTRARILATHRRNRVAATTPLWLVAAALVVFFGGSMAWAYWSGRIAQPAQTPVAPVLSTPHEGREAPPTTAERPSLPPTVAAIDTAESASQVTEALAPEAPTPSDTVDPRERAAYRTAHALHFDAHDPEGALAAWDGYLARYPSGRFALEARYNRALCLVRLGRTDEAQAALAPFVAGVHGGYRQHEAQALAEALSE
jgi:hypothetical protein